MDQDAREETDLPHSDLVYHGYILPTSTLVPNPNPPSPPSFLPQPEISLPNPTELSTPIDVTENHTIDNQLIGVNNISANTAEEARERYDPSGMLPLSTNTVLEELPNSSIHENTNIGSIVREVMEVTGDFEDIMREVLEATGHWGENFDIGRSSSVKESPLDEDNNCEEGEETIKEKESSNKEKETINETEIGEKDKETIEEESGKKEKTQDSTNEISGENISIEQLFKISNELLNEYIEKEEMEEQINNVLDKLESIPKENIKCEDLYMTGIGKTLSKLKKYEGRIGRLSSRLVNRWKPISFKYFESVSNVLVFHAKKLEKEGVDTEKHLEDLLDISDDEIRAQDLLNSGIGDVVKVLRKRGGKIGKMAQELSKRWRQIIIKSFESDESDDTENDRTGETGTEETESIFVDVTSNKRKLSDEEGNKSDETINNLSKKRKEDKETDEGEDETINEKESAKKEKETVKGIDRGEKKKETVCEEGGEKEKETVKGTNRGEKEKETVHEEDGGEKEKETIKQTETGKNENNVEVTPPPPSFYNDSCCDSPDIDPKTKVAIQRLKEALKRSKEQQTRNNNSNSTSMSECDVSQIPVATPDVIQHQITFSGTDHMNIQNSTPVSRNLDKELANEGKYPCPKCGKYFKRVSSHLRFCKAK